MGRGSTSSLVGLVRLWTEEPTGSCPESGLSGKILDTYKLASGLAVASSTAVGTPIINVIKNKNQAKMTFIVTPATNTTACAQYGREPKARVLSPSSSSMAAGFSPKIRTKPPIGRALKVYSVSPFFTPNSFGGKPIPNSSTRMPVFLAAMKCPHSCTKISTKRTRKKIKIDMC